MNRPSDLERAMMLLMGVFNKYAGIEGRQDRLSKAEAKTLIEKEFPFFLKVAHTPSLCPEALA